MPGFFQDGSPVQERNLLTVLQLLQNFLKIRNPEITFRASAFFLFFFSYTKRTPRSSQACLTQIVVNECSFSFPG